MTIKKLRNKGTGKIGYLYANKDVNYQVLDENDCVLGVYDTLPRLIEEWEDYKLNIWYNSTISGRYTIEIDFTTSEEAKKAMDKLKAWVRLKDEGLHVTTYYVEDGFLGIRATTCNSSIAENWEDIDSLLGGEE